MRTRCTLTLLAAALAIGCIDPSPAPNARATARRLRAMTPPQPIQLAVSTNRDPRLELAEWTRQTGSGTLLLRSEADGELTPGPVLDTTVEISVTGLLARAVVRQRFRNPGTTWAEGIYVFPLPDDAAVDHMRLYTENRVIEGRIQEKEQARRTYERAKHAGKRASLVEQERPNIFTTRVANIRPGSEVEVEIEYQQTVQLDHGEFSLRFPMVVGPRYIPGQPLTERARSGSGWSPDTSRVGDASRITPPVRRPEWGPINPVEMSIDLAPGFEVGRITSPYHPIRVDGDGGRYRVDLARGPVPADRDFVLEWTPNPGDAPTTALFTESHGDEHYALLMVMPPHQPEPQPAPPARELIFVIDTSGSMEGASIEQAKLALPLALERMRPGDRFNLIEFNSTTRSVFPEPQDASPWNVARALEEVRRLDANGGTNILPAIHLALANQEPERGLLRQVVFLTDGSVGNERELFEAIDRELGASRLFTVGIGSAPNTHFMRKAAQLGRGSFTHIGSPGEVAEKMMGLFRKLESVVLADIELELIGDLADQFPREITDLYLGEPVVVAMKLASPLDWASITGRTDDAPWRVTLDHRDALERPGIHVLWARSNISDLMDRRLGMRDERVLDDLRTAVVEVALEHHLVSAYTSLVAVDVTPERPGYADLASHTLETNLPAGWHFDSVFGMATTATGADLRMAVGLLMLACGWLRWASRPRVRP